MIMFVAGLVNSILSLITFLNKESRKLGCGIYLLTSSITSLLTITMFTIKFWSVFSIQLYAPVSSFIIRMDCSLFSPLLKLFLYFDGWLNACVAIERTFTVFKGVGFDQKMSRYIARWVIIILPILIIGTIIHEPIQHEVFKYPIQQIKHAEVMSESFEYETVYRSLCITRYSHSLQSYNTFTLFFHLIVPFVTNLCSALLIIFGSARRRAAAQKKQTYKQHVFNQINEHKQLLISPLVLLILALPRLIIALVSGCVDPSDNPWLYLCGYFVSYIPAMVIFIVFVLPSEFYMQIFKESIAKYRHRRQKSLMKKKTLQTFAYLIIIDDNILFFRITTDVINQVMILINVFYSCCKLIFIESTHVFIFG